MSDDKDVGLGVPVATVVAVVLDAAGKCICEAVIETKGQTVLDFVGGLRGTIHLVMLTEAKRHGGHEVLQRVPALGPVRAAQILAAVGTPHRFRTKRQFWPYCG